MNSRCIVLLNTKAGALKMGPSDSELENRIKETLSGAEIVYTTSSADLSRRTAEYVSQGVEKIVVSGGDGTVHLAVQALAGSNSVLGILPMGTANNFATALHLPIELSSALTTVKDGVVREVSLGKINDHFFTESAGVGLFADGLALYGAGSNKNFFKGLASVVRLLLLLPRSRMKITFDDHQMIERAAMCTVANTFRFGDAYPIAPEAVLTDDFLDLVVIGDIKRREIIQYYRAMKDQDLARLPKVSQHKVKTVSIESFNSLNVHCDDRIIGTTPVTIQIAPRILKVLTPKL